MSDSGITKGQYWNKRNCGHERVFFYQSSEFFFFRDKPFIETMAANLMTSGPCQLKLTIEGSERNSRHKLGSIDTDLKYPCNNRHRQQNAK